MTQAVFELLRRESVAALNLTVEEYRHARLGTRHLHLASADPQNAFLVAFLTVPQDSTGVAHILEHTALCGSARYPVRDPFFLMLRRSLATFMNAMTSADWTAYPFASLSRKDFGNLLDVYLDAAFFPTLDALDFAQEGWRVEFAKAGDPASELTYKGVVFNEMKGAMSAPTSVLWHTLARELFPTTTYRHNSGGDPAHIPDLTYAQLKAFHARHYHPGNAVFCTYGDIPAAEHQAVFEARVLSRFEPAQVRFSVPPEQRYQAPRAVEDVYGAQADDTAGKTHIVLGWLLGELTDVDALLRANLIARVLLDNSAAPLLQALETSALGSSPSPLCGLDDSSLEMVFAAGLEGSEPQHAQAVEQLVLETLERVARDGVPQEQVEAMLHQIELSRREVGGDRYPYGLQLIMTTLPQAIHGGDPVAVLALDSALARLRAAAEAPGFVQREVRRLLLDNPHRVRVVLKPDPTAAPRAQQAEQQQLAALRAQLDEAAAAQVVAQAQALAQRQGRTDDPEVLPSVRLSDVAPDLDIPQGYQEPVAGMLATWYDRPTNGLVYLQYVVDLPALDAAELELLPLLSEVLSEVGCGGRDYLQTQALHAAVTGGISASVSVGALPDELADTRATLVLSGKALTRNHGALARLMLETLRAPRFDEHARLRELIAQARDADENAVTGSGHTLAMAAATAGLSPAAHLAHQWNGLAGLQALKRLDDTLDDPAALATLAQRLGQLAQRIARAPLQMLVVAEADTHEDIALCLAQCWHDQGTPEAGPRLALPALEPHAVAQAWTTATQVSFCARAYPTVPWGHPDAPVLTVLGQYLRNGYLHTAIRERGGAYGGGAGYDGDSGALRFYSYRDPRLEGTLADFDAALRWLHDTAPEPRAVEEAILGIIAGIDRPGSPAGEARKAFHAALYGRTPQRRREFRRRVLAVTIEDLRRVATQYLDPARASTAVVTGAAQAPQIAALGLATIKL